MCHEPTSAIPSLRPDVDGCFYREMSTSVQPAPGIPRPQRIDPLWKCSDDDRALDPLLDLTTIGSMWRVAAHRFDGLVADHQVDVGASHAERIIVRQAQIRTSLPPPVLCPYDAVGRARDETNARPHASLWRHDGNPVAFADPPRCRGRGVHLDDGLRQHSAQARQIAVLAVAISVRGPSAAVAAGATRRVTRHSPARSPDVHCRQAHRCFRSARAGWNEPGRSALRWCAAPARSRQSMPTADDARADAPFPVWYRPQRR
jgi:hypothetical protein